MAKEMALRYGVVGITDIRLNTEANGIEFVLTSGDVVNVPFTASDMPFDGTISETTANNVQTAIDEIFANKADVINTSIMFYVDGTNGDDTTGDGTISKPVKTISKVVEIMSSSSVAGFSVYIAYASYTESGDIALPNKPIKIYGNMSTINNTGHTITIQNPEFYCNDLIVAGAVIFAGTTTGRVLCDNVKFAGNITCSGFSDLTKANISGGTLTVASTADVYLRGSKNFNQILSTGKLTLIDTDMIFAVINDYLIKSTAGTINTVNSQIINTNYTYRQMAVYCHNDGSAITPNIFANANLTVYGVINSGTAYTSVTNGGNIFSPSSFAVSSNLTPLPIIAAMMLMALGSDATGDTYYCNTDYETGLKLLTRLGIGADGTALMSNGTTPSWETPDITPTIGSTKFVTSGGIISASRFRLLADGSLASGASLSLNGYTSIAPSRTFVVQLLGTSTANGYVYFDMNDGTVETGTFYKEDKTLTVPARTTSTTISMDTAFVAGVNAFVSSVLDTNDMENGSEIQVMYGRNGNGTGYNRYLWATQQVLTSNGGVEERQQRIAISGDTVPTVYLKNDSAITISYKIFVENN